MKLLPAPYCGALFAALIGVTMAHSAEADTITHWNDKAGEVITAAKLGTPAAIRVMAIVQTAVLDAVHDTAPERGAKTAVALDAAVAAAQRRALLSLVPAQQPAIDAAYHAGLAALPEGEAKLAGVAAGERAAAAVLAARANDGANTPVAYRPHTTAGQYVPTVMPAIPQWSHRTPWLMASAAQFRPGAPPALSSAAWTRDFNEVKELGGEVGSRRTAEQTEIARFWEYSLPAIYFGVVRSVASQHGRNVVRNARLYAAAAQAMDDAMIGVFEAKYHYNFWRPVTAIRNADLDDNDATQRDAGWKSLIDSPMHPEYPSGHSILAAAVGAVLKADLRRSRTPTLSTTSPTANGATRRWGSVDDFVREVSNARVYAGIHYRAATQAGEQMGERVGELAASKLLQPLH